MFVLCSYVFILCFAARLFFIKFYDLPLQNAKRYCCWYQCNVQIDTVSCIYEFFNESLAQANDLQTTA